VKAARPDARIAAVSPIPSPILSLRRGVAGLVRAGAWILLLGWLAAAGASAATLRPELKLEARYDDNVGASDPPEEDLVRVIAPGLGITSSWPLAEWRIWARRSVTSYSRAGSLPVSTTDAASLRARTHSGAPVDLRFASDLRRSRDDSEPDDRSLLVPGDFRSGTGTGELSSRRLEASGRVAAWNYRRPERIDATTRQAQITLLPIRGRTHDWLVSYRGRQLDLSGRRVLTSHAALAGFRRRHSARVASRWEGGVAEVDREDGSGAVRRGAFTAGLTVYDPGRDTPVAEIRVEHDAATSVEAEARRRLRGALLSATWRRRLEALGGYDVHPVIDQRVGLSLADTLGRRMVVSVEGSYAWTRPYRAPGSGSDTYRAGASLDVALASWVSGRLGYDFLRQEDRDRPDPLDFRRNRIILSLTGAIR
jgi:hypothetical protein